MEVNHILKQFKYDNGNVNFEMVLSLPTTYRIPILAKKNFKRILMLIIGAVTMAMESINFKRSLNEMQMLDLAEAIIDTAHEDNLSFEDIMLFLQKLVRGEYDISYESIDIPKFMKIFEMYREKRWQELNRIREEYHSQYKCCGDVGKKSEPDQLSEHFARFGSRLSEMKNTIENLKADNKSLKMDNL